MADADLWRDRNKVFVAGIPATWDDAMLEQKFRPFGEMFQSKVVYDPKTGNSKGFGFITFREYVHALEAVSAMNQTKWENRVLNVRFLAPKTDKAGGASANGSAAQPAQPRRPTKVFGPCPEGCTSVYVGNLPYDITDKVLRKVFQPCGDVKAVRLANHIETKEFRGFGYVQFYDGAACEKAVQLDGTVVMGRPMNLDYGARDEVTDKVREDLQRKLKKGVCHKFQSGQCPRGDDCKFAHVLNSHDGAIVAQSTTAQQDAEFETVPEEDDSGVPICQSYLKGKCKRGENCKFRHVDASAPVAAPVSVARPVSHYQPAYEAEPVEEPEEETPVCQSFLKGKCSRGDKCRFRHVDPSAATPAPQATPVVRAAAAPKFERSRYTPPVDETPVCLNFQKGTCQRGDSCRFRHVEASAEVPVVNTAPPAPAPAPSTNVEKVVGAGKETTGAAVDAPICQNFLKGKCKRGSACRFRHVEATEETLAAIAAPPAPTRTPVTVSAPVGQAGPPGETTAADDDAPICQNYLKSKCKRGAACRFRHVDAASVPVAPAPTPVVAPAVVPTISICRNFQRGRCMRGTSCRFAHTDGDDASAAAAAAAAVVAAAAVTTAHSEYQKRFQSVCYNWQNSRSCVRGDSCPFYHDGAETAATETTSSRKETEDVVMEDDEEEEEDAKKSKKEKKAKKEKKEKKEKKRKAADGDDDSDDDDDDEDSKKKSKKAKKHKKKASSDSDSD